MILSLQGKEATEISLILKFKISRENENFARLISAIVGFDSSLILKTFLMRLVISMNTVFYLVQ